MSTSAEPDRLGRALRVAGVLALLVIQGGCGFTVWGLHRMMVAVQQPSREARHAAAEAADVATTLAAVGTFPAAIGYVDRFTGDGTLEVMTQEVLERVRIDALTIVTTRQGHTTPASLYPGCGVIVSGDREADGGILADVLVVDRAP